MSARGNRAALIAGLLAVSGCINPFTTRLPTVATGPPEIERQLYQRHDPFPLSESGPGTQSRPRGFENPRPLPRRIEEERFLQGLVPPPNGAMPVVPPAGARYPGSVQQ